MSKLDDLQKTISKLKKPAEKAKAKPNSDSDKPNSVSRQVKSDSAKTQVKKPAKKQPISASEKARIAREASIEAACQEFILNGGDQSKAYRKAFPASLKWKDKTVWSRASELFADSKVQGRVKELQELAAKFAKEEFKVDARYVLQRLHEIDQMDVLDIMNDDGSFRPIREWPKVWRGYINSMDFVELFEGRGDDRKMIGILKKIKWPDKVRNLELLGKCASVQAFNETYVHTGPGGGPIQIVERRIVRAGN